MADPASSARAAGAPSADPLNDVPEAPRPPATVSLFAVAPETEVGLAQLPAARVEIEPPPTRSNEGRVLIASMWKAGLGLLLVYLCLFNFSVVRGSSMAPSIHDGDRILIDPISYYFHDVDRGDIVVLKYPLDPSVDYIKRVIGLPGDEVVLARGRVWVNGVQIDEPYVNRPDYLARLTTRVKPAHFFVLGDNRRRSCDSREFGQVPQDYVRGRVQVRVWPPTRFGPIEPDE